MRAHLDLFSGIGGFALAARWCGFETVAFCEIDPYAQKIISKNFGAVVANADGDGCEERAKQQASQTSLEQESESFRPKIFGDIQTLDGTQFRGIDLLTGGFPCQPYSLAGKRRGAKDDRALWPEMLRIVNEARPTWVLAENVPGLLSMVEHDRSLEMDGEGNAVGEIGDMADRVGRGVAGETLASLEAIGYTVETIVVPACAVDARHRRDRVWIVANLNGSRLEERPSIGCDALEKQPAVERNGGAVADAGSGSVDSGTERAGREARSDIGRRCAGSTMADSDRTGQPRPRADQGASDTGPDRGHDACGSGENVSDSNVIDGHGGRHGAGSVSQQQATELPGGEAVSNPNSQSPRWASISRGECCVWEPEPGVGRGIARFSDWLDGLDLMRESHKLIVTYGTTSKAGPGEVLQALRNEVSQEGFQRSAGVDEFFPSPQILFAYLRKLEDSNTDQARLQLESPKAFERQLRGLRPQLQSSGSPHGPGHSEQHAAEHPDSLQALSRLLARDAGKAWMDYRRTDAFSRDEPFGQFWEEGLKRVATGVSNRVDRLRCLGNSIVPQVAAQIISHMIP